MSIIIYSTPTCGHCRRAKEWFKEKNIIYEEVDVSRDRTKAEEMIQKSGQSTVPVIEIDGKILVGFDAGEISKELGI
jgi:glutaredoxin-like YruB-family protein